MPPTPISNGRSRQARPALACCRRRFTASGVPGAALADPPPWRLVLTLYDALLAQRDDPVVRINRAVALAEIAGPETALAEIDVLDAAALRNFPPYHAVRADLLRRLRRSKDARTAYDAALDLDPAPAGTALAYPAERPARSLKQDRRQRMVDADRGTSPPLIAGTALPSLAFGRR